MKNEYIFLLLNAKISEKGIVKKIMIKKDQLEKDEALNYHIKMWEIISTKYFRSFEKSEYTTNYNYYSYVLDGGKSYRYEKDKNCEFYDYTGISYQCRDLLLTTIRDESIEFDEEINQRFQKLDEKSILESQKMSWMRYNDRIYSILSDKIMSSF